MEKRKETGQLILYQVEGVDFSMVFVPGLAFPYGVDDKETRTLKKDFYLLKTQVTYQLFYDVRSWACRHSYTFLEEGQEGSQGSQGSPPSDKKREPVTMITWYDAIIFCNALSEYLNYTPVYYFKGHIFRDATDEVARDHVVYENQNGFRLPTSEEWELAARYKGRDKSYGAIEHPDSPGYYWTPGNFASGAKGMFEDELETEQVAWYERNSGGKTQDVGQKPSSGNELGLYDMSGNVSELCFDWNSLHSGIARVHRGGGWLSKPNFLQIGHENGTKPIRAFHAIGFRFAQNSI